MPGTPPRRQFAELLRAVKQFDSLCRVRVGVGRGHTIQGISALDKACLPVLNISLRAPSDAAAEPH
eukprot:5802822-Pyramimonas_sp.AAC.1